MSRFYSIVITDQNGKLITTPSSIPGSNATYTSFANNQTNPGALQVEFDIPLAPYSLPVGSAAIRIWGVTLKEISQASDLNQRIGPDGKGSFFNIAIYGGMQKGLPLANPAQAGLLIRGSIFQAYGNWIGTDQTLDLIVAPDFGTNATPKNLALDWKAGTPLRQAIANTLSTAFPKLKQQINISDDLVLSSDQPGYYNTVEQFASFIKQVSFSIIGKPDYPGVDIFLNNGTFYVFDGTTQITPKPIAFQDLIGQPTWIEGISMQFKTAMRGDIKVGDYVKMPAALVTTTAAAASSLVNLKSAFEGSFVITMARHVGNFRQPTADAWVSIFDAFPSNAQSSA